MEMQNKNTKLFQILQSLLLLEIPDSSHWLAKKKRHGKSARLHFFGQSNFPRIIKETWLLGLKKLPENEIKMSALGAFFKWTGKLLTYSKCIIKQATYKAAAFEDVFYFSYWTICTDTYNLLQRTS